jgi:hypothetical protein
MDNPAKMCFSAPLIQPTDTGLDLPFFEIFVVGCIITYLIDLIG